MSRHDLARRSIATSIKPEEVIPTIQDNRAMHQGALKDHVYVAWLATSFIVEGHESLEETKKYFLDELKKIQLIELISR